MAAPEPACPSNIPQKWRGIPVPSYKESRYDIYPLKSINYHVSGSSLKISHEIRTLDRRYKFLTVYKL